jgi:putative spermidine/putrescine transport system substrate-binding protein
MFGRLILRALVFASLVPMCGASGVLAQETLRFGTYGGSMLEAQKVFFGAPFTELTGANIEWTGSTGEIYANRLIATAGRTAPHDLILMDEPWYSLVRVRGLLDKLDPASVPNLSTVEKTFRLPEDYGTCLFTFSTGIVYNKEKFSQAGLAPPTRWQDLADPKLAGRVGTQTMAASAPKNMLAAYAIAAGDPPAIWDRAIEEVAKIRFHSFSSGVADLMAKIEAGDVWAAPLVNGRAFALVQKGLPVEYVLPDNGNGTKGGIGCATLSVPKGARAKTLAHKLISFALSPGAQLMQASDVNPYGPVINSLDRVFAQAPKIAEQVPWGAAARNGLLLSWDAAAVDRFPAYVEAWNRKVQK